MTPNSNMKDNMSQKLLHGIIDEQLSALLELIEEHTFERIEDGSDAAEAVNEFRSTLRNLPTWISASSGLPSPNQVVLARVIPDKTCDFEPFTTHASLGYDTGSTTLEWGTFPYGDLNLWVPQDGEIVSHWMRIPEFSE